MCIRDSARCVISEGGGDATSTVLGALKAAAPEPVTIINLDGSHAEDGGIIDLVEEEEEDEDENEEEKKSESDCD